MRFPVEMFRRLPVARKLLLIVGVFVAIVICVSYLAVLRSEILGGVRAYVGGEGLWSKAEKRAVFSLTRYASTRDERDYDEYASEILVPEGDKQARLQLQGPNPDMAIVRQGFLRGRNSPDDIESMATLFQRFGRIGYMARAIAIWTEGDAQIDQLHVLAEQLRREVRAPNPDLPKIQQLTDQIAAVDSRVTPLENAFSSTLGEGARWISRVLSLTSLAATALLLLIGIALAVAVLKQIRNSEEKYRNLINTANDAILVIDAQTRLVVEANGKACEMLGFAEAQLVGMAESQLYPVNENETLSRLLIPQGKIGRGQELELRRADGMAVPVEVRTSATELGGHPAVVGIFRDIRERLEAAAVLRRSQRHFSQLIENISDVIAVIAVDGTMLYFSPSVERVTGYRPSDLLGHDFIEFVHPENRDALRAVLEQMILKPGIASFPEHRFRHRDGSWVWLESVANNLATEDSPAGIVVISRDISSRRGLEEQVRQSQKMEAVGRLAGGIAHDFNNLLMVIRGYAEIVLQEANQVPAIQKNIETIIRTTDSAANLTRQLLSFTRKHSVTPQVLDLNSLVNRISEMLLGLLREEVEFVVKLDPEAGCVSADVGQIEQVIMNLVVNARDAMPGGGALTLETAVFDTAANRDRRPPALPAGDFVMLSVTDTGIGMDADTQSRIFEPFFTTKSREKGTGLGLSVVYNIVRGCAGHVHVNSAPGRGSSFQLFFPRVARQPEPLPAEKPAAPVRVGMETILVAEDQPDLRWMICQFLQELGYSVLEARDGSDALALAEHYNGTIDVLLTDVVMPHVRGPEVWRRLSSRRPELKVIFMSGYTEGSFTTDAAEEIGFAGTILQKPFELNHLADKIREVIAARSPR